MACRYFHLNGAVFFVICWNVLLYSFVFPDGSHYSVPATCLVMQRSLSCSRMLVCVLLHRDLLSLVLRLHLVLLFSLIFEAFCTNMFLCFFSFPLWIPKSFFFPKSLPLTFPCWWVFENT